MKKFPFALILPFLLLASQAMATTFTVSSLTDSGQGSLRAAIQAANASTGSTIAFGVSGTISLSSALPDIVSQVTIDGSTALGFSPTTGTPVVSINFSINPGLNIAVGADGSMIKSLSLVRARNAAVTVRASKVTVQGNYIGLLVNGTPAGNIGDGVMIVPPSAGNLIGNSDPVSSIDYTDTADDCAFTIQPVSAWQGIRNDAANVGQYLIC